MAKAIVFNSRLENSKQEQVCSGPKNLYSSNHKTNHRIKRRVGMRRLDSTNISQMKTGSLYKGSYYTWIGSTCVETQFSFMLLEDIKRFDYGDIVDILRVCVDAKTKEVTENAILPCLLHWLCDHSDEFRKDIQKVFKTFHENDILEL